MLALSTPIITRLRALPALAGWDVRGATEPADRRPLPAVDVRCEGASAADSKTGAAMVAPLWTVTAIVRRSASAAAELDAAFAAIFASLHAWAPGQYGGRGWERLALQSCQAPVFADEGQAAVQLNFTTAARYSSDNP